jgi:hypothetical protein
MVLEIRKLLKFNLKNKNNNNNVTIKKHLLYITDIKKVCGENSQCIYLKKKYNENFQFEKIPLD